MEGGGGLIVPLNPKPRKGWNYGYPEHGCSVGLVLTRKRQQAWGSGEYVRRKRNGFDFSILMLLRLSQAHLFFTQQSAFLGLMTVRCLTGAHYHDLTSPNPYKLLDHCEQLGTQRAQFPLIKEYTRTYLKS